jgi:hypothetical protein
MTAAVGEVMKTTERTTKYQFNLLGGQKALKGTTAMGTPSTGTVRPAVVGAGAAGANDIFLGFFAETVDNSAVTAGGPTLPVTVDFIKEKAWLWRPQDGTITTIFTACYALDNQTVSATSTNAPKLGTVMAIDSILGVAFEVEGV